MLEVIIHRFKSQSSCRRVVHEYRRSTNRSLKIRKKKVTGHKERKKKVRWSPRLEGTFAVAIGSRTARQAGVVGAVLLPATGLLDGQGLRR